MNGDHAASNTLEQPAATATHCRDKSAEKWGLRTLTMAANSSILGAREMYQGISHCSPTCSLSRQALRLDYIICRTFASARGFPLPHLCISVFALINTHSLTHNQRSTP